MDNEEVSSESDSFEESVSDELFHDSIEAKKDNRQFSQNGDDEKYKSKSRSRTDLVLDLRNVPSVANAAKSDDEISEKLSAVIEQPEEHVKLEVLNNEEAESLTTKDDLDEILRDRINSLANLIVDLREQIKLALSLWRKERDEFQLLREKRNILAVEEATAAARAAAEAYAAESPLSNEIGNVVNLNPVQSLSELAILEYEKKLAKYQDALALAQAEKRYNMRRKMIANTYRQRLDEVERMCDEELEKIRESANILQPLRQIASQWVAPKSEDHKDAMKIEWDSGTLKSDKQTVRITDKYNSIKSAGFVDDEVNMIPELVAARFSCTEASKYERHDTLKNTKTSQGHRLVESNSLPCTWYASASNSS
ncbi:uncharacterized protein [Venturia canescens]|uniref:uncharacterized protein n=1 Tax=Venturia canescens TaxID=32260 RepID=UPI001C9BD686|nr:uncharacterized protein LOC122405575 [Venturia canescens]XP_043266376.1 uncharacterized protein LOC122405575 [Venturia canescens]